MEETQLVSYDKKWKWIWLKNISNYNFCVVELSGIKWTAQIFVHLSFIFRTLFIEIFI